MVMNVKKFSETAKLPEKAYGSGDLGYDIFSDEDVWVQADSSKLVDTGIGIEPPKEWGFFIKDRSSYASSKKLETAAGVIDSGYRNEIKVLIRNHSTSDYKIEKGDKIAQLVPIPVTDFEINEVESLEESKRGERGFGSSD